MPLVPGTRLGPYEILSSLGAGGMGEVYRARDTRLGRDVAIKIVPPHGRRQCRSRSARFEREAQAVAALSHPNILTIYDFGQRHGVGQPLTYAVMELLEGRDAARAAVVGRAAGAQGARHRRADRARPGRRARQADRASRPEAGERLHHDERRGEDPRLRPRAADRAGHRPPSRRPTRRPSCPAPSRGSSSAPSATWRPSRCAASRAITTPTCSRSAACSTRCSPAVAPTSAIRRPRR